VGEGGGPGARVSLRVQAFKLLTKAKSRRLHWHWQLQVELALLTTGTSGVLAAASDSAASSPRLLQPERESCACSLRFGLRLGEGLGDGFGVAEGGSHPPLMTVYWMVFRKLGSSTQCTLPGSLHDHVHSSTTSGKECCEVLLDIKMQQACQCKYKALITAFISDPGKRQVGESHVHNFPHATVARVPKSGVIVKKGRGT
jgi:hypothetical protein